MKLKTHKASAKRLRITKTGKILKKRAGQDHFNAREPGNVTRMKRGLTEISQTEKKSIRALLPYL